MKRIGSLAMGTLTLIAVWSLGPMCRGTEKAYATPMIGVEAVPVVPIVPLAVDPSPHLGIAKLVDKMTPLFYDVSTAFDPSAGGYGGPGNSGGSGDALLRIVNSGNFEADPIEGSVCANIYVFNDIQEEQECCSCPLTPNSLMTFSVINNLISNPANPRESLDAGVINIVGSAGACSNSPKATTAAAITTIAEGLNAWLNHTETMASNQAGFTPPFGFITSTSVEEFTPVGLDSGELTHLQSGCAAINNANSFFSESVGICKCGLGD